MRALAGLLLLTLVADLALLGGDFVWDDTILVVQNLLTDDPANLGRFFGIALWDSTPLPEGSPPFYRPMMLVELLIDRTLFGLSSTAHRAHSLAWHLLAVGLLFRWLLVLRPDTGGAVLGAGLFALHPLHQEVVAFVAARNDAMATVSVLGVLVLLAPRSVGPGRVAAAGALALYGLLSKESAAVVLPALLAFDLARFGTLPWRRYLGVLVALGAWWGLRSQVPLADVQLQEPALLPAAVAWYADALVRPWTLDAAADLHRVAIPWGALGAVGLVVATLAWAGGRVALAGLVVAGLALAPAAATAVDAGGLGHRYTYLPLAGLAVVVHLALAERLRPSIGWAFAGGLAVLGFAQAPTWSSSRTLWENAFARNPNQESACGLFRVYRDAGQVAAAEQLLTVSLIAPPSQRCCFNASAFYVDQGRFGAAVSEGEAALEAGCEASAELVAPVMLGAAVLGDWDRALHYAGGLKRDPTGYLPVVQAAAALRAGEDVELDPELRERAAWVLSQSEPAEPGR